MKPQLKKVITYFISYLLIALMLFFSSCLSIKEVSKTDCNKYEVDNYHTTYCYDNKFNNN